MGKTLVFIVFSAIALFLSNAGRSAAAQQVLAPVVAEMENSVIRRDALERELLRRFGSRLSRFSEKNRHFLSKRVLRLMIHRQLLLREVSKRTDSRTQQVLSGIARRKESAQEEMAPDLPEEDRARNDLVARYITNEICDPIVVSEREVEQYYDTHKEEFRIPEEVRLSHILCRKTEAMAQEEHQELVLLAENIAAEARKDGAEFSRLARRCFREHAQAKGGDYGWVSRGQLPELLEIPAFALEPGQTAGPIESTYGLHIIRVEDRRGGRLASFAEVQDEIRRKIAAAKQSRALANRLQGLWEEARVIVYLR